MRVERNRRKQRKRTERPYFFSHLSNYTDLHVYTPVPASLSERAPGERTAEAVQGRGKADLTFLAKCSIFLVCSFCNWGNVVIFKGVTQHFFI